MDNPATKLAALDACPWCGTTDHLSVSPCGSMTNDMPARPHRVVCNHLDCEHVQGPVAYGRFEAIDAWNKRALVPRADMAEGVELLKAVYEFADSRANGAFWHFRDQEFAKNARTFLAHHEASDGGGA